MDVRALQVPSDGTDTSLYDYGPHSAIVGDAGQNGLSPRFTVLAAVQNSLVENSDTVPTLGDADQVGELAQVAYGTQQEAAGDPGFVIAEQTHLPASGLNPESWITHVITYASTARDQKIWGFPGCTARNCQLEAVTLFGTTVVVMYADDDGTDVVTGFAPEQQRVLWTKRHVRAVASSGPILVLQSGSTNDTTAMTITAVTAETGDTAWSYRDKQGSHEARFALALGDRYGVILSPPPSGTSNVHTRRANVVDLQTGATIGTRYALADEVSGVFDPVSKRIVLANVARTPDGPANLGSDLEVWDTDGSTVFAISSTQYAALGSPAVVGALDGRAWVAGMSGSGVDVFDESTGKQDPISPKLTGATSTGVPTRVVGSVVAVGTDALNPARTSHLLLSADGVPAIEQVVNAAASE